MVINDQQNTVRKFIFAGMLFVLYIGYVCSGTHGYKQTYMHTHVYIYIYTPCILDNPVNTSFVLICGLVSGFRNPATDIPLIC